MAFYKCWISTDIVGSRVEETIELDNDLSEEEIEQEIKDYIFQYMEWGFEKTESENDD